MCLRFMLIKIKMHHMHEPPILLVPLTKNEKNIYFYFICFLCYYYAKRKKKQFIQRKNK